MSRPPIKDKNSSLGFPNIGSIPPMAPVASFNYAQIEDLIRTKGFDAYHFIGAPSPDRDFSQALPDPNAQGTYQGQIYYDCRPIKIVPYQMKNEEKLQIYGIYGLGSAVFNISGTYYDDRPDKIVYMNNHDLIMMNPTITVKLKQLFEHNPAGPNKLNFQVKGIEYLGDKEGKFEEGVDFGIIDGDIYWLQGGRKPKNQNGKKGAVTCVYYATPIYSVVDVPHNLRILPSNPQGHGAVPREATYFPQLIYAKALTSFEVPNILDWRSLPPLPGYDASMNTMGGI